MQAGHRGSCIDGIIAIAERCAVLRPLVLLEPPTADSAALCSTLLTHEALKDDPQDQHRYRWALLRMLNFAIEKLNHKGERRHMPEAGGDTELTVPARLAPAAVYANVLAFSSRVFALAFFRLEGVALKLLRSLPPVKRQGLKRILEEAGVNEQCVPAGSSPNCRTELTNDPCPP